MSTTEESRSPQPPREHAANPRPPEGRGIRTKFAAYDAEIAEAALAALAQTIYAEGPETEAFEAEVAAYCHAAYGVAASSGTGAMVLAFSALGFGPGDDIIIPANAFISVAESAIHVGARPVFCDISADTTNADLDTIAPHVTPRTRGIVVLHNYGHPVDIDPVLAFAQTRGIRVVEDAAHGLGGAYKNRPLGSLGDIGILSFNQKSMSVGGWGGMALTNDSRLADAMKCLSRHGWRRGEIYQRPVAAVGYNFRLNEVQAAIGRVQLRRVDRWRVAREANALMYDRLLADADIPVTRLTVAAGVTHARLHYVIKAPHRDGLMKALADQGIETAIHYRRNVYRDPAFIQRMGYDPGRRPVTDEVTDQIITLPSHPGLGDTEVSRVTQAIVRFFR